MIPNFNALIHLLLKAKVRLYEKKKGIHQFQWIWSRIETFYYYYFVSSQTVLIDQKKFVFFLFLFILLLSHFLLPRKQFEYFFFLSFFSPSLYRNFKFLQLLKIFPLRVWGFLSSTPKQKVFEEFKLMNILDFKSQSFPFC